MKKVIVISDSFKGSLTSGKVAEIAAGCIRSFYPDCAVTGLPVADGGEGTVDCFLQAVGGTAVAIPATGPWREPLTATYARIGDTAVIEMAAAAGLPLAGDRLDPSRTTTYGVGQLIRHAVQNGARKIVLGLGGSATNDGGCGCAAALGTRFVNRDGNSFCPTGATLSEIASIDNRQTVRLLEHVRVEVMCDVDNPLCGPRGAAAVFGPQKGADAPMVAMLDDGLAHLSRRIDVSLGIDTADIPGAGAAGGFGAGAVAFLNAELRPGIEVVLDMLDFDHLLDGCSLVITGEGRIDGQSLRGKVPVGVARRASKRNVPVIAIVGDVGDDAGTVYDAGITAVFSINRKAIPFSEARMRSADDYRHTLEDILRYTKAIRKA